MKDDLLDAKILIVDDQIANIEVLEHLLEMKGYQNFKSESDPRNIFNIIKDFQPDLLLLDLMMPQMNGYDIMEKLKSEGIINGFMPILVLTADATLEAKKRALSGGASDFLTKPFNLTEVELRIKNLLFTVYLMQQLKNQNQNLETKVTERTSELMRINAAIQDQNIVLKDIAWTQSHVVRAPLARLLGLVSLLQLDEESSELTKGTILEYIIESANELDNIIKEISIKAYSSKIFD
jgi:two-component system sensor histidine kinase/response regulator